MANQGTTRVFGGTPMLRQAQMNNFVSSTWPSEVLQTVPLRHRAGDPSLRHLPNGPSATKGGELAAASRAQFTGGGSIRLLRFWGVGGGGPKARGCEARRAVCTFV